MGEWISGNGGGHPAARSPRQERFGGTTEEFIARVAKKSFSFSVNEYNAPVAVNHHQRNKRRFNDLAQQNGRLSNAMIVRHDR